MKQGNRKTTMGFIFLGLSTALTYILGDIPPNMLDMLKYLWMAFVAGNSLEHIAGAMRRETKPVDLTEVTTLSEATLETSRATQKALTQVLEAASKARA